MAHFTTTTAFASTTSRTAPATRSLAYASAERRMWQPTSGPLGAARLIL